ncbi:MAG: amidase [Pseudomonadota bacterium]
MHFQTLSETVTQLKSGAMSSVELTQHMLGRIDRHQDELKCYAYVLGDSAMAEAEQADAARASGEPLGALHGIPIAIKDLVFTQGIPTASGTQVMSDFRPTYDATVLSRLRAAGAVILGKLQLTEGAFGSHHPAIPAPVNPYGHDLWPGVSSSGSGVGVAAGLAFGALGTDTGGSIRFPSASCGLVGMKPTYGRVSRYGVFPLAQSLDHIGPMARSVADTARMLGVIAGEDQFDTTSLRAPVPNYLAQSATDLNGFNLGIDWDYVTRGIDSEVVALMTRVVTQFEELGAHVQEVVMPTDYVQLVRDWGVTCAVECAQAHHEFYPERASEYGPVLSRLLELGLSAPREHYLALEQLRTSFTQKLNSVLDSVDAILAPCMTMPVPTNQDMDTGAPEQEERAEFITFTAPFDYSGHPTLTLPAGLDGLGRPESFQLIGRHLGEDTLFQAGFAYEGLQGLQPHPPQMSD